MTAFGGGLARPCSGSDVVAPCVGPRPTSTLRKTCDRVDAVRRQRIADELAACLAGGTGTASSLVPQPLGALATSMDCELAQPGAG